MDVLNETVFRSEDVPPADRFDLWSDLVGRTHAPLELVSDHHTNYLASQRVLDLGPVSVWPTRFQPVCFRRTPKLIRQSDPETLHVSLVTEGVLCADRGGTQAVCGPERVCVVDSSRPVVVHGGNGHLAHSGVGLEVPKALLPLSHRQIDRVADLRMSWRDGFGELLARLLGQLAAGTDGYRPADGPRLGMVAVDLLSALVTRSLDLEGALPPETCRRNLVLQIKAFIQQHLCEVELTPHTVAAAHHISVRYLHRLFQDEGESVASSIRRQRLERAHRDLTDPALRTVPVHQVAARWGFIRAADFTRTFRAAYGTTPTEHRRRTLDALTVRALHGDSAPSANDNEYLLGNHGRSTSGVF